MSVNVESITVLFVGAACKLEKFPLGGRAGGLFADCPIDALGVDLFGETGAEVI